MYYIMANKAVDINIEIILLVHVHQFQKRNWTIYTEFTQLNTALK